VFQYVNGIKFRHVTDAKTALRLLILLVLLTGCNSEAGPDLVRVSGKVTLDGRPLESGIITFLPDNSRQTSGPRASGIIDKDGRYTVASPGNREGVIAGHHLVVIHCNEVSPSPDPESEYQKLKAQGINPDECLVPAQYQNEKTSGLTAEVRQNTSEFNFELQTNK